MATRRTKDVCPLCSKPKHDGICRLPLADLVEDFDLYPRHAVDNSYVGDLVRASQAGSNLPVPVIWRDGWRIIDGFHRVRCYARLHGKNAEIPVEIRTYPNEAAAIKDAVALNASHGRKLDSQDKTRSALMLERAGVSPQEIAVTLHVPEKRVREIVARVVIVKQNGHTEKRPAKPGLRAKRGEQPRVVTADQYAVSQSSSGWGPRQTVRQLIRELEADLVDEELQEDLELLHRRLGEWLGALAA
jgi:hypothetical protein